jgi:c-di-GMP-binding flagellar brake protein YcgR
MSQERRKHPRFELLYPFRYKITNQAGSEGVAHDISQTGILIYLDEPVALGSGIEIILELPANLMQPAKIIVSGRVVRLRTFSTRPQIYEAGVELEAVKEEELAALKKMNHLYVERFE